MVTTTSLYDQFLAVYTEKEAATNEPWLQQLRTEALKAFSQHGFPTIKNEEWRFTNLSPFLKEDYSLQPVNTSVHGQRNNGHITGLDAYEIVMKNGLLNEDILIPGVRVQPFRTAFSSPVVQQHLGKNISLAPGSASLVALNTALFDNGIVIEIGKNVIVDKPIHITHVYNAEIPFFVQPRILIVADKGSKVEIIESYLIKGNEAIFANSVTECYVAENARVDQYNLQFTPDNARIVNFTQVAQKKDSLYNNYTYILPGAALVRNNLHLNLDGTNTESHLYGLYLAGANQLVDNHTLVNHLQPHCMSNELYKGVLMDNARAVFNGKIFVQQDAQKTNAFQQNNNMLLSDKAVVDSKPQLEIFADDVKCSHGSTMGSFNAEALFYLKARGIGEASARNLLVKAFAFDVTNKMQIPAVREYVEKLITSKMEEAYEYR